MSIFTRTPMHVGAGSSVGVVDLPIIRERHTSFPVIPGSSLKGVLADLWNGELKDKKREKDTDLYKLFGSDDASNAQIGNLLVGEGQLAVFPVRSAKGGFAWLTCPLALGRLAREIGQNFKLDMLMEDECWATDDVAIDGQVILEEYCVKQSRNRIPDDVLKALGDLSEDELWKGELAKHLVIVSDDMFKYFVENTCEIAQHVKIDDELNTAEKRGLFNQENVPAETMFVAMMVERGENALQILADRLKEENNLLQIGADATTGLGWCTVALKELGK